MTFEYAIVPSIQNAMNRSQVFHKLPADDDIEQTIPAK